MNVGLLAGVRGRPLLSERTAPGYEGRVESITEHLSLLLNTRRGAIQHLPDYGLPDSTVVSMRDRASVFEFGREIEKTVQKYEPRLMQIQVKPEPRIDSIAHLRLAFRLEAKIVNRETQFVVRFLTSGSTDVEYRASQE